MKNKHGVFQKFCYLAAHLCKSKYNCQHETFLQMIGYRLNLIFFIDSLVVIVYGRLEFPIIIIQNITVMENIAPVHIMEVRILRAHFHKCKISKFTWINKCIVNILLYLQLDKGFLAKIAVPSVHCVHFCG